MEVVLLKRQPSTKHQTLGELYYKDKLVARTLELPWIGNMNRISCIPKGEYKVIRRYSSKYGNHFYLPDVPKRSYILIHNANYYYDLLGCIGVGEEYVDINKDGETDIANSKQTLQRLLKILPNLFTLKII